MTVVAWPQDEDGAPLGAKAQGLIDLDRIGLRTPPALIVRDSAIRRGATHPAIVDAMLDFVATLPGARRAVSLRCAVKHGRDGAAVLPPSLLDIGLCDIGVGDIGLRGAGGSRADDDRTCAAHATAFFAFFGREMPVDFARQPLRAQLETAVAALVAHFAGLDDGIARTLIVQQMVHGDADPRSLTGMCYTRHPRTGEPTEYGHFLVGRRGMALGGVDDPAQRDLAEMRAVNPRAHAELLAAFPRVEAYHRAVRQLEFTAEGDTLYLLQNVGGNSPVRLEDAR